MTSKELSYLEDAIKAEKQVIKKYQTYVGSINDASVKAVCKKAALKHNNHYQTLLKTLNV